ncbi:MAG: proline dehydrogenase family protein [Anaerolineales bacterium]|nr:proline dehydrogenase family protein [Anaerolineales bacterium]
MLRAILLYLSGAVWARRIVMNWGVAQRMAGRFIAGDNLDAALASVKELNARGLFATLDHLGEHVTNAEEARQAAEAYVEIFHRLAEAGVKSNCSLKLTQLGLALDFDLCLGNMRSIASRAAEFGTLVRIDMEDSGTVDRTLQIYNTLREEGLTNIGVVIQSYLYRSEEDVEALLADRTRIRLCKGAYNEPPEVAYPRKADVDENFDRLTAMLIDAAKTHGSEPASADGEQPPIPGIATHDPKRIQFARDYAEKVGLPKGALEFQMLHGIGSELQLELADAGYPVRIYVPYGTEWYPYFMRRLAERPANLWFFIRSFLRS